MDSTFGIPLEKVIIRLSARIKSRLSAAQILSFMEAKPVALPKHAYFQGKIVPYSKAKVGVLTHALNYGTAAFGGVRAYWHEEDPQLFIFRAPDHLIAISMTIPTPMSPSLPGGVWTIILSLPAEKLPVRTSTLLL